MPRQQVEQIAQFPLRGINVMFPRTRQPEGTCVNCVNVVIFDGLEGRARGGTRPGLARYHANTVDGGNSIQDINYITVINDSGPDVNTLNYRQQRMSVVCNGNIFWVGATINAANTTGSAALNSAVPVIFSTTLYGKAYFTDGLDYKIWNAASNEATDWTPTAGSLPGDPGNTAGRLITSWRSRIVVSGLRDDSHNWFMSAVGDPLDWDYGPANTTETQAIQGGIGVVGPMDDVVTCLAPYNEDILIMGGDHSIWQMSGDPQAGGRFDMLTSAVGIAWGRPYCQDPTGVLYFFSSRCQVYRMVPEHMAPQPLTDTSISTLIENTNLDTNIISMTWDDKLDGVWLFITPYANAATTHYFWHKQTEAWFPIVYANTELNPVSIRIFDGDSFDDRTLLLGSNDGYINKIDFTAFDDIGVNYVSHVTVGPFMAGAAETNRFIVKELQALSDADGADIGYELLIADTPQAAHDKEEASFTGADGTFAAGLSLTSNPNLGGYYAYLKYGSIINTAWALEHVRVRVSFNEKDTGRTRS